MTAQTLFFLYSGAAFLVALVAIVWGSQQKILGAALLLGSVILSNVFLLLFGFLWSDIRDLTVFYGVMDLTLAGVYAHMFADKAWLAPNKWAGALAAVHLAMAGVNAGGVASPDFGRSGLHGAILNGLVLAAFAVCLVSFTPKSMDEAKGVAKVKWAFWINDMFGRVGPAEKVRTLSIRGKSKISLDRVIGGRVRDLRKDRGLSQEDLAAKLGLNQPQIYRIEAGTIRITATQLFAVARVFGVSMDYFTSGIEKTSEEQADGLSPGFHGGGHGG